MYLIFSMFASHYLGSDPQLLRFSSAFAPLRCFAKIAVTG